MNRRDLLASSALAAVALGREVTAQTIESKPVPGMQVLPLPYNQATFELQGKELTRYHYGPELKRPFLYPINGPSGRSLTRMGHPQAPASHIHHNSVWVSHNDVNGDVFWGDTGPGRIVHQWMVQFTDADNQAGLVAVHHWIGKDNRLHLIERRGITAVDLSNGEWLLIADLQLEADKTPTTLGKTPFGLFAVRMAKSIGVSDGGGTIRNSAGNVNETGDNGVFWKRARWVDYSGPILPGVSEGIAMLDHPANPGHPAYFHVRNDGWMGASLCFEGPITVEPGKLLRLRYGLYIHSGVPKPEAIDLKWSPFSKTTIQDLPNFRK
jgi:hypothetical protein